MISPSLTHPTLHVNHVCSFKSQIHSLVKQSVLWKNSKQTIIIILFTLSRIPSSKPFFKTILSRNASQHPRHYLCLHGDDLREGGDVAAPPSVRAGSRHTAERPEGLPAGAARGSATAGIQTGRHPCDILQYMSVLGVSCKTSLYR